MPEYNATENTSLVNNAINNPRNNPIRPAPNNSSVNLFAELIKKPLELLIPAANAKPSVYAGKQLTEDNFNLMKQNYDGDGAAVAKDAGGKVWQNVSKFHSPKEGERPDPRWVNTCGIRLSHAMNHSNLDIPKPSSLPSNIKVLSSDNDGNFIYRAKDFSRYMEKTNDEPISVKDDLSNIQGKKGVIYFDNYHIDLWDETNLVGNGSSAFDYINNRNKPAVFWEAK